MFEISYHKEGTERRKHCKHLNDTVYRTGAKIATPVLCTAIHEGEEQRIHAFAYEGSKFYKF